jgi:hypothetical protein
MLEECLEFLDARIKNQKSFKYEIIVVSDGSKDKTVEKSLEYSKKLGTEKFRVLELVKNRGKGGAVRLVSQNLKPIFRNFTNQFFLGNAEQQRSIRPFC